MKNWFPLTENDDMPEGLLDARLRVYDPGNENTGSQLIDLSPAMKNAASAACHLPSVRWQDRGATIEYYQRPVSS